jgi:hypothetical protein
MKYQRISLVVIILISVLIISLITLISLITPTSISAFSITPTPSASYSPNSEGENLPSVEVLAFDWSTPESRNNWLASVEADIDPANEYFLEANVPGYAPVAVIFERETTMGDMNSHMVIDDVHISENVTVTTPEGTQIGPYEALARQVHEAMLVAADENGIVTFQGYNWNPTLENPSIEQSMQISVDAPVVIVFGSYVGSADEGAGITQIGGNVRVLYSVREDGSLEVYVCNVFTPQNLSSMSSASFSSYINNIIGMSLWQLALATGQETRNGWDNVRNNTEYAAAARTAGITPAFYLSPSNQAALQYGLFVPVIDDGDGILDEGDIMFQVAAHQQ